MVYSSISTRSRARRGDDPQAARMHVAVSHVIAPVADATVDVPKEDALRPDEILADAKRQQLFIGTLRLSIKIFLQDRSVDAVSQIFRRLALLIFELHQDFRDENPKFVGVTGVCAAVTVIVIKSLLSFVAIHGHPFIDRCAKLCFVTRAFCIRTLE